MSVLITGGVGLLGPVVAEEYLKKEDDDVILLDVDTKEIDFLEEYKDRVEMVKGDITDFEKILNVCEEFEVDKVAHLAAIADVDVAEKNPLQTCDVNVKGTYNVLETCRRLDIDRMVYASTGAVYGKAEGPIKEDTPYNPAAIYGATKVMGEVIGLRYDKSYDVNVIINRLYFLYGPRMFFEPISPFGIVKNAVEGKPTIFEKGRDQLFEFTHVRDAARGIILSLLADSKKLDHRIFNISYGKTIKLSDFAEIVKKYVPEANIELGPGELGLPRGFPLDITRAKKELSYEPKIGIEEGIKETITWLKEKS